MPDIIEMDGNSDVTVISFNNHPKGKAVDNAKMLADMLQDFRI